METFYSDGAQESLGTFNDANEAAIAWLVRLTSGDATRLDHEAFAAWRSENPAHEKALAEARQLWVSLGQVLPDIEQKPARRVGPIAIAAAMAACLLLGFQYAQVWRHDVVTGVHERRNLTLSDGTSIWLSPGSALDIHYGSGSREVELARGEAFFKVVHDPAHPFTVKAGKGVITDIGTEFAVDLNEDGKTKVTVAEGSVSVSENGAKAVLIHDQRLAYDGQALGNVEPTLASEDLAWTRGRLILEDKSLAKVLADLNHYAGSGVLLLDDKAGERHISAVIDLDHATDWLNALRDSQNLRIAHLPGLVLIY